MYIIPLHNPVSSQCQTNRTIKVNIPTSPTDTNASAITVHCRSVTLFPFSLLIRSVSFELCLL